MKTIEESVVTAMDGTDKELFPFLPYILQDVWEIGADPNTIINLIKKYFNNLSVLKVLDLGCGKGAVSINISRECGCTCKGIDAVPEFIAFAKQKAAALNVGHLCSFEVGDIREKVKDLSNFDIVVLGAIGPVFGDYFTTFSILKHCINHNGIFIIDDGYIDDASDFTHPMMLKKSVILQQLEKAGMQVLADEVMDRDGMKSADDYIFNHLKKRCDELIAQMPDKTKLFQNYIENQLIENDVLESKIIGTTMVIKKK